MPVPLKPRASITVPAARRASMTMAPRRTNMLQPSITSTTTIPEAENSANTSSGTNSVDEAAGGYKRRNRSVLGPESIAGLPGSGSGSGMKIRSPK